MARSPFLFNTHDLPRRAGEMREYNLHITNHGGLGFDVLAISKDEPIDIDLKIEKTEDDRIFLVLVVDCEKMDKNSGKFDQSYFDFVTDAKREKPKGFYIEFEKKTIMSPIARDFEKYMNLKIHTWFHYKNHDYLDDVEAKIEKLIQAENKIIEVAESEIKYSDKPRSTIENLKIKSSFSLADARNNDENGVAQKIASEDEKPIVEENKPFSNEEIENYFKNLAAEKLKSGSKQLAAIFATLSQLRPRLLHRS